MSVLQELEAAIVRGDLAHAADLAGRALAEGASAETVLNDAALPAIRRVGELWDRGEYFMPEVVMSGEAFKNATARVRPHLTDRRSVAAGTLVIGTVEGDVHDLGKNLVSAMLEGAGFEVVDLGVAVPTRTFVERVKELAPDVLALGAYMSTTMQAMGDVIEALIEEGLREGVGVLVGGIPVTRSFADQIGADAYGADVIGAVAEARRLVKGGR